MGEDVLLAIALFFVAMLYSSVGHGGGSGYLAVLALLTALPQQELKAVALTLNVAVASVGTWRFVRAGHFHFGTFWPFAVCAVPMAFVGGLWRLPAFVFGPLIGLVLLFAAWRIGGAALKKGRALPAGEVGGEGDAGVAGLDSGEPQMPGLGVACGVGAVLGLMAGLTGTGGGIFLSPLLLVMRWADAKRTAAVSVAFVLVNSAGGLAGLWLDLGVHLPGEVWLWLGGALGGGFIGSWVGAKQLPGRGIQLLLAGVLLIAAVKLFVLAWW